MTQKCPPEVIPQEELWRGTGQGETLLKSREVKGNQDKKMNDKTSLGRGSTKTEFVGLWKQKKTKKKCLEEKSRRGARYEVLKEVNTKIVI